MQAVVGLGANLGDRLGTLRAAVGRLARVTHIEKTSHVYGTAPVGGPAQPDFLNAAALVVHSGDALHLLDTLLGIERGLGRVRAERWGPRIIDLDILWIEGVVMDTPRLRVPHPCLLARAFALVPMLEIAPQARDPQTGDLYVVPPATLRGDVWITGDIL